MNTKMTKITTNGEISQDPNSKLYYVNNETWSEWVCITPYLPLAFQALDWYARTYLSE